MWQCTRRARKRRLEPFCCYYCCVGIWDCLNRLPYQCICCSYEERERECDSCACANAVFHAHRLSAYYYFRVRLFEFTQCPCARAVYFVVYNDIIRIPFAVARSHTRTLLSQCTMDSVQLRAAAVVAATICRGSGHNLTRSLIIIISHERQTHYYYYYANVKLKHEPLSMCQRARLRRLLSWFDGIIMLWFGDNAIVSLPCGSWATFCGLHFHFSKPLENRHPRESYETI